MLAGEPQTAASAVPGGEHRRWQGARTGRAETQGPPWQDVHTERGASERETGVSPRKHRLWQILSTLTSGISVV